MHDSFSQPCIYCSEFGTLSTNTHTHTASLPPETSSPPPLFCTLFPPRRQHCQSSPSRAFVIAHASQLAPLEVPGRSHDWLFLALSIVDSWSSCLTPPQILGRAGEQGKPHHCNNSPLITADCAFQQYLFRYHATRGALRVEYWAEHSFTSALPAFSSLFSFTCDRFASKIPNPARLEPPVTFADRCDLFFN